MLILHKFDKKEDNYISLTPSGISGDKYIIHDKENGKTSIDFAPDIHDVFRNYPLVTLTRMAEMAALYINWYK